MSNKIQRARETIRKAFEADPNFRNVYKANIAMYIWDEKRRGVTFNKKQCNDVADELIKLIFET